MRKVLWVVGEPGVGKTAIVREMLKPSRLGLSKPKFTVSDRVVAAGHYTGDLFDGADTVPYNGVADALDFWLDNYSGYALTVFDGDRFSFKAVVKFFQTRVPDHELVCVHVHSEDVQARRAARANDAGKTQNPTWVKGRITKTKNFFDAFPGQRYELNNVGNPADVAKQLLTTLESP